MTVVSASGVSPLSRHVERGVVPRPSKMMSGLPWRLKGSTVSSCRVDAGGVPAEWVEATVATEGQPTIVYLLSGGVDALEQRRPSAGDLAVATGARVFTVACLPQGTPSSHAAVENGMAAYTWLLGEGCDLDVTVFTHDPMDAWLVDAILVTAVERHPF